MPAYTKNGYAVMKIPSQLYELINEAKTESKIVTEECNEVHQNCAILSAKVYATSKNRLIKIIPTTTHNLCPSSG